MRDAIISADSHITEAPETYTSHIASKWKDRAPVMKDLGNDLGDMFVIDGMKKAIPMGLVAAAGKAPEEIRIMGSRFKDLHRSGWDPKARRADQIRD